MSRGGVDYRDSMFGFQATRKIIPEPGSLDLDHDFDHSEDI